VGQWQVQLILLCVKAILWLQAAALVVTAYAAIVDTVKDCKGQIAASE